MSGWIIALYVVTTLFTAGMGIAVQKTNINSEGYLMVTTLLSMVHAFGIIFLTVPIDISVFIVSCIVFNFVWNILSFIMREIIQKQIIKGRITEYRAFSEYPDGIIQYAQDVYSLYGLYNWPIIFISNMKMVWDAIPKEGRPMTRGEKREVRMREALK